jgi:hypothetical protein
MWSSVKWERYTLGGITVMGNWGRGIRRNGQFLLKLHVILGDLFIIKDNFEFKKHKEQPEEISLGKKHSIMITSLKRVFVWGQNKDCQLGFKSTGDVLSNANQRKRCQLTPVALEIGKIKKVAAGYKHTLFINSQGNWFYIV